jgi:hypothetical protein
MKTVARVAEFGRYTDDMERSARRVGKQRENFGDAPLITVKGDAVGIAPGGDKQRRLRQRSTNGVIILRPDRFTIGDAVERSGMGRTIGEEVEIADGAKTAPTRPGLDFTHRGVGAHQVGQGWIFEDDGQGWPIAEPDAQPVAVRRRSTRLAFDYTADGSLLRNMRCTASISAPRSYGFGKKLVAGWRLK